jgi:hypothetical protein
MPWVRRLKRPAEGFQMLARGYDLVGELLARAQKPTHEGAETRRERARAPLP